MIENEEIKSLDDFTNKNKSVILSGGGLDIETATDCMICGNAFMQDWQHKEYNMCESCRLLIRNLIGK